MGIDVEALTWAEHLVDVHGPYGSGNATPCEHWRGKVGDPERIRNILAEYARLVPAEDEGRPDLASEYGRLLAWRDRLVAEGADPADLEIPERPLSVAPRPAEDEGRLRERLRERVRDAIELLTDAVLEAGDGLAATPEPWTDPKG